MWVTRIIFFPIYIKKDLHVLINFFFCFYNTISYSPSDNKITSLINLSIIKYFHTQGTNLFTNGKLVLQTIKSQVVHKSKLLYIFLYLNINK